MDWEFLWRSDIGRDRLLRDRLEEQEVHQLAARAQDRRRMDGKLQQLQGNLEARLDGLTKAFEAYVELDDVREQLAGFPEHSRVRRLSLEAIQAFEAGRASEPVPDLPDYWLPPAVNALYPGGCDRAQAQQALARDEQSAGLFLAALLGANGYGAQAEDLVIRALGADHGTWDDAQQLLYRAVIDGLYGPGAVAALSGIVTARLMTVSTADWHAWVRQQAGGAAMEQLQWLVDAYSVAASPTDEQEEQRHVEDLRTIAAAEVSEGSPGETALLRRARELREVVRQPNGTPAPVDAEVSIVHVVQETAVGAWSGARQRQQAWTWLRPHLLQVVQQLDTPIEAKPAVVEVRGGTKAVSVTARGPEQTEMTAARRAVAELNTPDFQLPKRAGLLAGGLALGSIVMWLLSVTALGVLLGLAALVAAGVAGWTWWQDRGMAAYGETAQQRLVEDARRAQEQAAAQDERGREEARRHADLVQQAREAMIAGLTTPITS